MLGLLEFKKSVFSGVLDGGPSEVFLGGTRLTRFMESVEKATAGTSQPMPVEAEHDGTQRASPERRAGGKRPPAESARRETAEPAPNPWADLVRAGMSLVEKVAQALDTGREDGPSSPWIERDDRTGRACLKLPLPSPEIAGQLHTLLAELTKAFRP